jgi:hypothetical protein
MAEAKGQRKVSGKKSAKRSGESGPQAGRRKPQAVEAKPARARPITPSAPAAQLARVIAKRPEYVKLGELLVRGGLLSDEQRQEIVEAQKNSGRPFGDLAERMFGVSPRAIERAWGQQLVALLSHVDLDRQDVDPLALSSISRRQAWQFEVFPLRFLSGALVVCTSEENLIRAMKFAGWRISGECQFVLTDRSQLGSMLEKHFPIDGMTLGSVGLVA